MLFCFFFSIINNVLSYRIVEVDGLDTEGLITFLKERRNLHLNETHYNIFRHKEIAGSDFLSYTKEEFESFGLNPGPAKRIEQLVNELNGHSKFYEILYVHHLVIYAILTLFIYLLL
jgi:hypothetical protein